MKLVSVEIEHQPHAGILDGDEIALLGSSLKDILASGQDLRKLAGKLRLPAEGAKLLAPIPDPGLVLSVGMNYHEHLKEMKTPVPEKPAAFTKSVASIIGSGEPIKVPPSNPDMLDWEGEFSVVIGKPCHRVSAARALDHVAGYTLVNDVSARDWVAPIFKAWMEAFNDPRLKTLTANNTGGTDHLAFDAVGLPGFQFIQDPVAYGSRTHHSNQDVYERLVAGDMKHNAAVVATFVYLTANRDQKLPRKTPPTVQ